MQGRAERLAAVRKIVSSSRVGTQEELTRALQTYGYEVTQATVSRDMADLGLVKVRRGQQGFYSLPEIERLRSLLQAFWSTIDWSGPLVVLKTSPGTAQGVAAAVDAVGLAGVIGTVGGDDTTLIIAKDEGSREEVVARMNALHDE
ncbi:MAG: arginine repressor [Candidatus Aquicultorales bacterium]